MISLLPLILLLFIAILSFLIFISCIGFFKKIQIFSISFVRMSKLKEEIIRSFSLNGWVCYIINKKKKIHVEKGSYGAAIDLYFYEKPDNSIDIWYALCATPKGLLLFFIPSDSYLWGWFLQSSSDDFATQEIIPFIQKNLEYWIKNAALTS